MKKQNFSLIIIAVVIVLLTGFKVYLEIHRTKTAVFPLTDIQLGKINKKSKQVIYTNSFVKGDEFLISFKNTSDPLPLKILLTDSKNVQDILLADSIIKSGENEICCFDIPKNTDLYNVRFIINNQEIKIPLEVKDKLVEYKDFNLMGIGTISYPNWEVLDISVINNLLKDIFSYYSKDLGKGISVLLAVEDEAGAQFTISRRVVSNYKNMPFGNLVETIETNENKALLKAGIIDDYKILEKSYGNQEIYLEIRNISKGISYLVFNKTFLEKNLLNQKILLSISFTCPEKLVDFYQPVLDRIFSKN